MKAKIVVDFFIKKKEDNSVQRKNRGDREKKMSEKIGIMNASKEGKYEVERK